MCASAHDQLVLLMLRTGLNRAWQAHKQVLKMTKMLYESHLSAMWLRFLAVRAHLRPCCCCDSGGLASQQLADTVDAQTSCSHQQCSRQAQ